MVVWKAVVIDVHAWAHPVSPMSMMMMTCVGAVVGDRTPLRHHCHCDDEEEASDDGYSHRVGGDGSSHRDDDDESASWVGVGRD
jgi:hypothetical protein